MQREQLADFLRRRRESIRPADVGIADGPRRRTAGLRREEVAMLAGMSVDYVVRLEQGRSSQPSTQLLAALARALRLSDDERSHLFHLAGHQPPPADGIARLGPAWSACSTWWATPPPWSCPTSARSWRRTACRSCSPATTPG
ncbi:helix-turn-helix domain-containing protein [Micromonospora sp. SD19]